MCPALQLDRTKDCLKVELAGIELADAGRKYLLRTFGRMRQEPNCWFTLIRRHDDLLSCEVHLKRVRTILPLTL